MRKYTGIEIFRLVFACLIPLLHIGLPDSPMLVVIRQYVSRLGVPYFFAVSGAMLSDSIVKYGRKSALMRYAKKIARLLVVWLVLYAPLLVNQFDFDLKSLSQQTLFKTPAYLWYLTSLLVASIPFCLSKNRMLLYFASAILMAIGTVFGDTYRWLVGQTVRKLAD